MKVKVRTLRHDGIDVKSTDLQAAPPHVGLLRVEEARDPQLSRQVVRARLLTPGTDKDILRELLDARLLWADAGQMRLTGFEQHGAVSYAQTWSVELG
ncbi:MAG: hypothetical protein JNK17_17660 [Hydrogenophaga sp.]|nr:hypothetical protein [Hydrogenophaga sp.]